MFCPNCGTNNEDGAVFCANCGTSMTAGQVQPEVQVTPQQVQPQAQPVQAQPVQAQPMQGQPMMGQPMMGQQPAGPNNGAKAPFKISKQMIIIGAAALAAIVAVIVFICVGKSLTDYKKTVKKYIVAEKQCDFETAYSLINLPKSEFLTKEAFINSHKDETGEKIAKVVVSQGYSTAGNLPGNKAVIARYSTATGSTGTENLMLTVSNKHYMLFFKKYKISSEGMVVTNCKVRAPKGSKLTINGVEVDAKYIDANDDKKQYDTYVIPYLFMGYNDVKISGDLFNEYTDSFYVWENEETETFSASSLELSSAVKTALENKVKEDVKTIAKAAVDKAAFSAISNLVYNQAASTVETSYSNYCSYFTSYSTRTYTALNITNVDPKINSSYYSVNSDDGLPYVKVSFSYSYTGKYDYKSGSTVTPKEFSSSRSSNSITYKYVNGEWKISAMSIGFSS